MGLFLFSIVILLIFISYVLHSDVFSPSKFYFLSLTLYFFDIFFSNYKSEIYLAYLYYIILGIVLIFFEIQYLKKYNSIQKIYLTR
jgi:hypothetical protein